MFRHVTEALRILTQHKLDKLLYDQTKTPNLSLSDMVKHYEPTFRKLLAFNFVVDDVLTRKLDAIPTRITELRKKFITFNTLGSSSIKLQMDYEWSITSQSYLGQPIQLIEFIMRLYDPTVKRNEASPKCPYRWFEFASNHKPCIDRSKADQTVIELSKLYGKQIQLNITDDCTTNAYEILDWIYTNELPAPVVQPPVAPYIPPVPQYIPPVPQYVAPVPQYVAPASYGTGLYEFIEAIETYLSALKSYNTQRRAGALADLAYKFNSLYPKAAYVFFTQKVIFRNSAPECRTLRGVQTVAVGFRKTQFETTNHCRTNLDKIDFEYLRDKINISVNTSTVRKKGLKGMDYDGFYQKATGYEADIYVNKTIGKYKHENEYTDTPDPLPTSQYGGTRKRRQRRKTRKIRKLSQR